MIPLILEMLASSGQSLGPSLVVGTSASPYARPFLDGGTTFTELTSFLSANPASAVKVARLSPLGDVLAVGTQSTPYLHFYDNGAKLANPSPLPPSDVFDLAWSNDGEYCAAVAGSSPYIGIYKRSGSTYAALTSPFNIAPASAVVGCAFSDDGVYLAITLLASPFMYWYKREGDVFTRLTNPASLPANDASSCAWAPSGAYLAVTFSDSPFLKIYKRTDDAMTATGVTVPTIAANSYALGLSWSADGNYLALSIDVSPYLIVLKRSGDTFTKIANPASLPASSGGYVSFSESDRIAFTTNSAALLYSLTADVLELVADTGLPATTVRTVSFYPASVPGSP
jgi:WD40 repeat protein